MSIDSDEPLTCPARVTLDAAQLAFLDELPCEAPSLQAELGCELDRGHLGSHAALAHQVEDKMWWVHWTLTASEINPYTWCPARQTSGEKEAENGQCELFDGHQGRHTTDRAFWTADDNQAA